MRRLLSYGMLVCWIALTTVRDNEALSMRAEAIQYIRTVPRWGNPYSRLGLKHGHTLDVKESEEHIKRAMKACEKGTNP